MSLTFADLTDLLRRAQLSELRGYTIARGDYYAKELGGSDGSPGALVALCRAALAADGATAPEAATWPSGDEEGPPPAAPEPAPEEPAAEEPPPAEEAPEEEVHDDSAAAYESWSKRKLVEAATERGLDVKSHMTKAEVIAALRAGS